MLDGRSAPQALLEVLARLRHFKLWVPLLLYLALKILFLALYVGIISGPLVSFWRLFLEGGLREAFVHYPDHQLLMPVVMGRFDIILDIFVHSFFQGVTVFFFAAELRGYSLSHGEAFKRTFRRYLPLVGVTIIASAAIYVCMAVPGHFLPKGTNTLHRLAGWGIATFTGLALEALFLFTAPLVLLRDRSVFAAIRQSLRIARENFTQVMILVTVPFLITLPAVYLSFKSHALALSLSPEILPHIQIFGELLGFFSTLFLVGGLTIAFLWRRTNEDKRY